MHDIGWTRRPTGKGHHKASEAMILEKTWEYVPPAMVAQIGNIARYHRKSPPQSTHPRFAALTKQQQGLVKRLAAILRIADAMDRSHLQLISALSLREAQGKLTIEDVVY